MREALQRAVSNRDELLKRSCSAEQAEYNIQLCKKVVDTLEWVQALRRDD